MIRSATVALVLVSAIALPSPAAACWGPVDPKELARHSPMIVTGTIVRIERAAPNQERYGDLAHILVEAVHKNVFKDVAAEPGGEIVVGMSPEKCDVSAAIHYPVGTRAIWITSLHEGLLRIDGHPRQQHPVESIQELGPLVGAEKRYTKSEWMEREERARRWEERGYKAQRRAKAALSF